MLHDYLRQLDQFPELQECFNVILSCWTVRKHAVLVTMPEKDLIRGTNGFLEIIKRVLSASPLLLDVSSSTKPEEILQRLEAASGLMLSTPNTAHMHAPVSHSVTASSTLVTDYRPRSLSNSHKSFLEARDQSLDQKLPRQLDLNETISPTSNLSLSRSTMSRDRFDSITSPIGLLNESTSRQLLRSIVVVRFSGAYRHTVSDLFGTFLANGKIDFNALTIHRMPESLVVFVCSEIDGVVSILKEQLDFCYMSARLTTENIDFVFPHIHRIPPVDLSQFDLLREHIASVTISPDVYEYLRALVLASRCNPIITSTTSTNAYTNLVLASKLRAVLASSTFVTPDHIQSVLFRVFRHRMFLKRGHHSGERIVNDELLSATLMDQVLPPV